MERIDIRRILPEHEVPVHLGQHCGIVGHHGDARRSLLEARAEPRHVAGVVDPGPTLELSRRGRRAREVG